MKDAEGFSERISRSARELAGYAGSRAGQLARAGRLQLDLLGIQRELQREYCELGQRALELIRRGEAARIELDPVGEQILRRISRLEAEKLEREGQIDAIRSGAADSGSAAASDRGREESL